jgi:stage II sporulation protein P
MFNIAVVNVKDIFKYLVTITITLCLVMSVTRYFSSLNKGEKVKINQKISEIMQTTLLTCLDETVPAMKEINHELNNSDEEEINETTLLGSLLKVELSMFRETEKIVTADNYSENITNTEKIENILPIENINECVQTEVVTQNPLADSYTVEYNGVKIKNETNYELTEDMMSQRIEVNSTNILIFHTHTCESYTSSEQYQYIPTGNYRTTDTNFTVARVGNELSKYLAQYGYNVIHDTTYHDYPAYSGSYNRSLNTVEGLLKKQDSDIIIDIHRDAIGSRPDYAPTVKIGEDYAAQLMFVIGTSGGGLWHPNWVQNFQFAIEVQEKANELYPGFFKPMILRNSRYNQHLGKAACIIEVGSTGNTLEQSIISMKYLSKVIDKVLK